MEDKMKVCGIEISENAECEFFGSPFGTDLSRAARLYVHNNSTRSKLYHITALETELNLDDENDLGAERCSIKFVESQNGNQNRAYAEITSGKFKGTFLFFKIENEKN